MKCRPPLLALALVGAGLTAPCRAAAPPPDATPEVRRLIGRLADEDPAARRAAMKALESEDGAAGALLRLSRTHPDVDVRLRALVVLRAIDDRHWGQVSAFGPGAATTAVPWGGGYWFNRVAFTPDGKHAVVGGGGLILFDLKTGREVRRTLEVGGARPGLSLSADGKTCLTGHNADPVVHLVEVPSLKVLRRFEGHRGGVADVALSADGRLAASAGGDGHVILWDAHTGKELRRVKGLRGVARCLTFSADGKRLLSGHMPAGQAPTLRLWDVATGEAVRALDGNAKTHGVYSVGFLPDGTRAVSAGMDGAVILWDLAAGKPLRKMHHPGGAHNLALSPDGKRALTAGFGDNRVRLWDLPSGRPLRAFDGHLLHALGVAFSADGRQALSCDAIATVRLWKLKQ